MSYKVLYIEDEEHLASIVKETLEIKGYHVYHSIEGTKVLVLIDSFKPDICILDIMLPYIDGYSLARSIRQAFPQLPIIFLTAKSQTKDILEGFASGGTDYVKKPFSLEELMARIDNQMAILQQSVPQPSSPDAAQEIVLGSFRYAPLLMKLFGPHETIKLSNRETEILNIFCMYPNEAIDRRELMKMIWGDDSYFISRNLDVYIRRLRAYFTEGSGVEIITLKGKGYHFSVSNH